MIDGLLHSMIVCPDLDRPYPRLTHGEGVYLVDEHGQRYLDAAAGSCAVALLGYGRTDVVDAMRDQALRASVLPAHTFSSPVVEEYLRALCAFAPDGAYTRAWTAMSGTDAVENALKVALQFHQIEGRGSRHKVLARWGSYHGSSVFTLDVGGMRLRRQRYAPWLHAGTHLSAAYAYRRPLELSEAEYTAQLLEELERTVAREGADTIAALVVEPLVGNALGAVPPPVGYLEAVAELCRREGILLVADEVMTGFGRTGVPFAVSHWGVQPDLIAAGKAMGGGYYPLSGVVLHERVAAAFERSRQPYLGGYTFACNPLGARVGLEVLRIMEEEDLVGRAARLGQVLRAKLGRLSDLEIVGDVRGAGLMVGVELVANRTTRAPFPAELRLSRWLTQAALERGVILYPGAGSADGTRGDHLLLTPPLVIDEDELERAVAVLDEVLREATVRFDLHR